MTLRRDFRLYLIRALVLVSLLAPIAAPSLVANDAAQKYPPTIVFMTDFGVIDDSVALCRGVIDRKSVV